LSLRPIRMSGMVVSEVMTDCSGGKHRRDQESV
jgi:hypothetical protein